jgi:hypothetical protein
LDLVSRFEGREVVSEVLDKITNLYTPCGEHLGFMVGPIGPFKTIGEAEAQARADQGKGE